MCRSDVNARRQLLKNPIKPRQGRQNSRFKLLPEVRERCQKSKKIDARAYVNEGSLQGRSRWPKPFQNPSQKHPQSLSATRFFSYFCPRAPQERPKSAQERPRARQESEAGAQDASKKGSWEALGRILGVSWRHLGAVWELCWSSGSVFEAIDRNIEKL